MSQEPDCFAAQWVEHHPECAGGYDPLYTDARGTHLRPQCASYQACGQAFRAKTAQQKAATLVPVQNLVQAQPAPPAAPPQPTALLPPSAFRPPAPAPVVYRPPVHTQLQAAPSPQAVMPLPPAAPPPQLYPVQYAPVRTMQQPHEAAAYLTTSEMPGTSLWQRIVGESLRAGLKGVLQQGAHIVDHTPIFYPEPKK